MARDAAAPLACGHPVTPALAPMRLSLLALALCLAAAPSALAQAPDRVPSAEAAFQSGLETFRAGDYPEAERLFRRAAGEFGVNQRTTAAQLMAARAAYAQGEFEAAISAATTLVSRYPESRYAGPARELIGLATAGGPGGVATPFDLGIALPVSGDDGYFGQAVFNGIRIAVDEHNARAGAERLQPVRMVFRDSRASAEGAETAVAAAVAAGADAIVGPLFSGEAMAAAAAAETAAVPLIAPLATDADVSDGRRYAFQANATFAERGRAMARYATGRLGLARLGVASQANTLGVEMAEAFAAEARAAGAQVLFAATVPGDDDWADLDRIVGESTLERAQAVYLPVTGAAAPEHAGDALRAIDGVSPAPRPLGNTEWEGLAGSRSRASRLGALFTQDFFVPPGAADAFGRRYRQLSGLGPDRLAIMGYDTASFLIAQVGAGEGALADRIRRAPRFDGIAHRFEFDGGQVNRALFILGYRDAQAVLLE